jgi:TonB dependent receptor/Carboxypeptidase regulatory-like domain
MQTRKRLSLGLFFCAFWASGVPFAPAWSQAAGGYGAVGGTVMDPDGNGLPDATIVLSNESLGLERPMDGTDDGVFYLPTVTPAAGYKLKVTRKNFSSWESGEFGVAAGQKVNYQITLHSLEGGAKPQAEGHQVAVDNTKSGVATMVPPEVVSETPSSGRRVDSLISLAPAVNEAESNPGVWVFHGVQFSNLFLTDGLVTTNLYLLQKPGMANQLSQDAVQSVDILSADFLTEFGGTTGGIVDAASRSGSNQFHGEAYGYLRDRAWQSADKYAMGYNTQQQQDQAGLNVGGPIRPDQIFFFANLDFLDRSGEGLNRITNPMIANPAGTQVLASNCQATAAQCAVATRFLQSQMNVLEPLWDRSYRGLARIDYRRSARNNISFEGNALQWKAPSLAETEDVAPNGGLIGDPILKEQTRFARIGWTATGSNQVTNDMRLGFYQDRITENPVASGLSTGPLGISIAGTIVGATQPYTAILPSERRYQAVDNGNWTLGSHTIRVGGDISWTRDYINSLTDAAGWYTYPSLTAFAQDFALTGQKNYTYFSQTLGNPIRSLDLRPFGVYAEDTWRASRRLTVTYGLRYERPHVTQPTETNTTFYLTSSITEPWLNLSPRFGAAYMLNDRTVVRAGYGWYYAPISGQLQDALYLGNALYQTNILVNPTITGSPVFPNIIPNTGAIPNGSQNVTYSLTNFRNPYAQEFTLAIERQILPNTTLTLSGLHVRGYKLWTTEDYNQANPSSSQTTTETYNIANAAGQTVNTYTTEFWFSKNNGNFAHVYQIENGGSSWYNGVSLELRRNMSHGLSALAKYTWSHAIDDVGQTSPFGAAFSSTFNQNYTGDVGNSTFDQRHRATIQLLWQPTVTKSNSFAARYLLNGWQVSTIATLASSLGVTPLVVVQGQQFSGVSMDYTSTLNGSDGWARVPFLPIGSLLTGPMYNVDLRISRAIPITDRVKGILVFEAFNALNTQYTTAVNQIAYTAISELPAGVLNGARTGTLFPVTGLGQGIAAQGFPDGTNARRVQVGFRVVF